MADRERVARHHQASLAGLIEHVADALDRYRAGQLDAYDLDQTIHH